MENNHVPYIAHEGMMARMERTIRRLTILAIVTVLLLFVTNVAWLHAWMQYDYVDADTTTVSQDGEGNNIVGDGNEVNDGAESDY